MKKKSKILSLIIQITIGIILGVFISIIIKNVVQNGVSLLQFLFNLVYIIIGFFISINLHEFGHFVIGKMFGYKLISYRIGFLSWNNENGKMKFSVIKNKGYGGLCGMLPPIKEVPNYKNILFYAAGNLVNIFIGSCLLIPVIYISNLSENLKMFLIILGGISLTLGITNFIPFFSSNNPTDGKLIWSLILKRPFAKQLIANNKIGSQLSAGVRPREISIQIEVNTVNTQGYDSMILMYLYFKALDSKNTEGMLIYADLLEKNIDVFPTPLLPGIYYELCYVGCITNDINKAKTYYEKGGKILQKDKDVNGIRVKGYYEYYINKNKQTALSFCESALAVANLFPIKGQSIMEVDLVKKLQEIIISAD